MAVAGANNQGGFQASQPRITSSVCEEWTAITLLVVGLLMAGCCAGLGIPGLIVNTSSPLSIALTGAAVLGVALTIIGLVKMWQLKKEGERGVNPPPPPVRPHPLPLPPAPLPKRVILPGPGPATLPQPPGPAVPLKPNEAPKTEADWAIRWAKEINQILHEKLARAKSEKRGVFTSKAYIEAWSEVYALAHLAEHTAEWAAEERVTIEIFSEAEKWKKEAENAFKDSIAALRTARAEKEKVNESIRSTVQLIANWGKEALQIAQEKSGSQIAREAAAWALKWVAGEATDVKGSLKASGIDKRIMDAIGMEVASVVQMAEVARISVVAPEPESVAVEPPRSIPAMEGEWAVRWAREAHELMTEKMKEARLVKWGWCCSKAGRRLKEEARAWAEVIAIAELTENSAKYIKGKEGVPADALAEAAKWESEAAEMRKRADEAIKELPKIQINEAWTEVVVCASKWALAAKQLGLKFSNEPQTKRAAAKAAEWAADVANKAMQVVRCGPPQFGSQEKIRAASAAQRAVIEATNAMPVVMRMLGELSRAKSAAAEAARAHIAAGMSAQEERAAEIEARRAVIESNNAKAKCVAAEAVQRAMIKANQALQVVMSGPEIESAAMREAAEAAQSAVIAVDDAMRVVMSGSPQRVVMSRSPQRVVMSRSPQRVVMSGSPQFGSQEEIPEAIAAQRAVLEAIKAMQIVMSGAKIRDRSSVKLAEDFARVATEEVGYAKAVALVPKTGLEGPTIADWLMRWAADANWKMKNALDMARKEKSKERWANAWTKSQLAQNAAKSLRQINGLSAECVSEIEKWINESVEARKETVNALEALNVPRRKANESFAWCVELTENWAQEASEVALLPTESPLMRRAAAGAAKWAADMAEKLFFGMADSKRSGNETLFYEANRWTRRAAIIAKEAMKSMLPAGAPAAGAGVVAPSYFAVASLAPKDRFLVDLPAKAQSGAAAASNRRSKRFGVRAKKSSRAAHKLPSAAPKPLRDSAPVAVPASVQSAPAAAEAHPQLPVVVAPKPSGDSAPVAAPASVQSAPAAAEAHPQLPALAPKPSGDSAPVAVPASVQSAPAAAEAHPQLPVVAPKPLRDSAPVAAPASVQSAPAAAEAHPQPSAAAIATAKK